MTTPGRVHAHDASFDELVPIVVVWIALEFFGGNKPCGV
jgi:hypothetical protein